ncbi:MAG: hypothetical protein ACLGH0_01675 [Thermoanaerobaculia bacterium]
MRIALFLAAVALLAACQPGPEDQTRNTPSQSSTMPPNDTALQTTPANAPIAPERDMPTKRPTAALPTQEVHLIEYAIHLPESVPAGRIAFNVENGGKEDHGFELEGNGVHTKTNVLKRGDTAALEVELQPGTYTVYCPVDGHRGKGMQRTLVVK